MRKDRVVKVVKRLWAGRCENRVKMPKSKSGGTPGLEDGALLSWQKSRGRAGHSLCSVSSE